MGRVPGLVDAPRCFGEPFGVSGGRLELRFSPCLREVATAGAAATSLWAVADF